MHYRWKTLNLSYIIYNIEYICTNSVGEQINTDQDAASVEVLDDALFCPTFSSKEIRANHETYFIPAKVCVVYFCFSYCL